MITQIKHPNVIYELHSLLGTQIENTYGFKLNTTTHTLFTDDTRNFKIMSKFSDFPPYSSTFKVIAIITVDFGLLRLTNFVNNSILNK